VASGHHKLMTRNTSADYELWVADIDKQVASTACSHWTGRHQLCFSSTTNTSLSIDGILILHWPGIMEWIVRVFVVIILHLVGIRFPQIFLTTTHQYPTLLCHHRNADLSLAESKSCDWQQKDISLVNQSINQGIFKVA